MLNDHKSHRLAVADEIERLLSRVTPKHIAYPPGIKNLAPGTHHMAPSDDGSVVSSALRTSISSLRFLHTKNIERLTFFSYSLFSIISLWFFFVFVLLFCILWVLLCALIESERCRRHPRIAASCGQEVWQPRKKTLKNARKKSEKILSDLRSGCRLSAPQRLVL